jgi:hypothetical protein
LHSIEQFRRSTVLLDGSGLMPHKNERVELEIKIIKYRALARQASDSMTTQRINDLILELEKKLREIDE